MNDEERKERRRASNRRSYARNRDKISAQNKERYNTDCVKNKHLKARFGITLDDYNEIFASQNGLCAICGTDAPAGNGWHLDHCHTSGVVRGILCPHCNLGLGHFKDNTAALTGAVSYLERYSN